MKTYWINIIDEFLIEKSGNEWLSKYSMRTYTGAFNLLLTCEYIDIHNLETFTELNFKRFLLESLNKYKWNSRTYNLKRMAFNVFNNYLQKRWFIAENPFKEIRKRKEEKALPRYLNTEQVSRLLEAIESVLAWNSFLNTRNRTIFYFFLFTWVRLAELRNMKLSDIDFIKWQISIIKGKWNKDRIVPLVNTFWKKLENYLLIRKWFFWNRKCDVLFPSERWNILWEHDIYHFFSRVNKKLPFHVTPHMLRHTYATELLRQWVHLFKISKILGHTDLETTQVYLWLDTNDIIDDLNSKVLFAY